MNKNEILKLIFHNNFSTTQNTDLLSGRGVGLYVVKKELEKIGGTIFIESILEKGTKFIFNLPVNNTTSLINTSNSENELSKVTIDALKNFIQNNINLEISNISHIDKFEIKDIYSTIKINLHNNVFIILSLENSLFNKFLSFFIPDYEEIELDEASVSSVIDEVLNIIMGYAIVDFPTKYQSYVLSTPLAMDKTILYKMSSYCETYNYVLQTTSGDINISILFSEL